MSIVITGVGLVTAIGSSAEECWARLLAGRSGLKTVSAVPHDGLLSTRAGEVREELFDPADDIDRAFTIGRLALMDAMDSAGLVGANAYDPFRMGLALGTSLGGARSGEEFHRQWLADGLRSADNRRVRQFPLHAIADFLAAEGKLRGARCVHSNACAAGAVALINGLEYLRSDVADVVIAGGVDPLAYLSFGGFSSLQALAVEDCAPYTVSDGLTLGEGAGFVVLERLEAAQDRGAKILAEFVGYGLSSDAFHPTAPDPRGRGAAAAMRAALEMAGVTAEAVGYINGHGTGTPANDESERRLLEGFCDGRIPMSSTKSQVGHTLGAAGGVEAVVTILALRDQVLPPTVVRPGYVGQPEFDVVPREGRPARISFALSNSFAFGGNNATLAFRAWSGNANGPSGEGSGLSGNGNERSGGARTPATAGTRSVYVSEIAAMVGSAGDEVSAAEHLFSGNPTYGAPSVYVEEFGPFPDAEVPDAAQRPRVDPGYVRKLDALGKRAVTVAAELMRKRALPRRSWASTGLVFATASGPLSTVERFQSGLIRDATGDPKLFPNTVMHAAAGHVALLFGLTGPTATYCSGATAGVSALHLAHQLIASGTCERVLVISADEAPKALLAGYAAIPGYLSNEVVRPFRDSGRVFAGAAAAILLESEAALDGRRPRAEVRGFGFAGDGSGCGLLRHGSAALEHGLDAAITAAGVTREDIHVVVSAATGRRQIDDLERAALLALGLDRIPVSAPKAVFGEPQATVSLLGILQAIWMHERRVAPELHHFASGDHQVVLPALEKLRVLVSTLEYGGCFQSLVVEARAPAS